jgi:hypothetical protein
MNTNRKPFDYNIGALAVVVISLGVAAIVYGLSVIPLDLYNLVAWFFGPLGVYTLIYSFARGKDATYYLVWGTIMVAVAAVFGFYNQVPILIVVGIVAITLAVIGVIAYWRNRK